MNITEQAWRFCCTEMLIEPDAHWGTGDWFKHTLSTFLWHFTAQMGQGHNYANE